MAFIELFELLFIAVFLVVITTQVFIPLFRGTLLFPLFRREAVLLNELARETQRQVEKGIEKAIEKIKKGNNE